MWVDVPLQPASRAWGLIHVRRHVCRHICRHVCRCVCRHVSRHVSGRVHLQRPVTQRTKVASGQRNECDIRCQEVVVRRAYFLFLFSIPLTVADTSTRRVAPGGYNLHVLFVTLGRHPPWTMLPGSQTDVRRCAIYIAVFKVGRKLFMLVFVQDPQIANVS